MSGPAARIDDLRRLIRFHEERYYVDDAPQITDPEFDALMRELQALEEANPDLADPHSPTQRVGGRPAEGFDTVRHMAPMLSLDNAYSDVELREFHARICRALDLAPDTVLGYVAELKIDGLSIALTYEHGRLVRGVTRGDGVQGEDVTHNVRVIRAIPLRLHGDPPPLVEIRGEVYFPLADFRRINEEREAAGEPVYQNPRNTAAGTMRTLDSAAVNQRALRAFTYQVVQPPDAAPVARTHAEMLKALTVWSCPVEPHWRACRGIDDVIAFCQEWQDKRRGLTFDTDGVVVKLDDIARRRDLGQTAKFPRWATAFKFPTEQARTKLLKIAVNIGRTGAATPYAVLDPVKLSGTTISMATLHNDQEVARRDIREGDVVIIEKGGEIIPKVVGPVLAERPAGSLPEWKMPTTCPFCESVLVKEADEVIWRCENVSCPARIRRGLEHFAGRYAMNIEGLGESLVDQLITKGIVHSYADVYRLTAEQVAVLDRMGKKSAANLIAEIDQSRNAELWRVLHGIGIRHVGEGGAKALAKAFLTMTALREAPLETIENVPDVGPVVASAVRSFFDEPRNAAMVDALAELGVKMIEAPAPPEEQVEQTLAGLTFVITGTLDQLSREDAEKAIHKRGGKVTGSISRKTSWLVVGHDAGTKLEKARALGVRELDEAAFLALIMN